MITHHLRWHKYYLSEALNSLIEAGNREAAGLQTAAERLYEVAHSEVAMAKEEVSAILETIEIHRKHHKILAHKETVIISRILSARIARFEWHLCGRALP
jgi:hypothetical protein